MLTPIPRAGSGTATRNACTCWLLTTLLLAVGCCTPPRAAARARVNLLIKNRDNAEPLMRAKAASLKAELLPATPRRMLPLSHCENENTAASPEQSGCILWQSDDLRAFRFRDKHGAPKLAVRVSSDAWRYARLARRGNTLIVLNAVVSQGTLKQRSACECYESHGYSLFREEDLEFVFVVEDLAVERLEEALVPINEDIIEWRCAKIIVYA